VDSNKKCDESECNGMPIWKHPGCKHVNAPQRHIVCFFHILLLFMKMEGGGGGVHCQNQSLEHFLKSSEKCIWNNVWLDKYYFWIQKLCGMNDSQ
jgi:hypothetical protein